MAIIPKASAYKIMKSTGAERISGDSVDALIEILEEYGTQIASKANNYAKHASRKTVQAKDIKMAMQ